MLTDVSTPVLAPRPVASSVEDLLAEATDREPFLTTDSKSGARFERVLIDREPHVLKYLHVDDDWIMRASGDLRCRPLLVWRSGILDALPECIDHAVVGAAEGLGRNGWGAAILMRDVSAHLVPAGDERVPPEQHKAFLDHMAALGARFWGFEDTVGLTPPPTRWQWFSPGMVEVEAGLGWPDAVPPLVEAGWQRFSRRAPRAVAAIVGALRYDVSPLTEALAATPATLLHGDWKLGNLGTAPDGRTILLDWAGPGAGPACHELAWYLALNQARLPEAKEDAIARYRAGLERHNVDTTTGWWAPQLALCLLGAMVIFGWEKALGDDGEFGWWCDRVADGAQYLR